LGNMFMAEMLIRARANVNKTNDRGITATHNAASVNHLELVLLLLRNGANRNIKSIDGTIPADFAKDENLAIILRGKKTSISDPFEINFIDKTHCPLLKESRIGMSMCPGRVWSSWQRDLNKDLKVILENKVQVICSVITNTELKEMNQPDLMDKFHTAGLESIHYSIHDKWLPNSIDNFLSFVDSVMYHIHKEKTILIHCNGGKGRTGLIVVTCLLLLGVPVDQGVTIIRSVRSGMLRNPAQEVFLHALSSRLKEDPDKYYLFRKESSPLRITTLKPSKASPTAASLLATHTHLSDSSDSLEAHYDSGKEELQANSSTEHS